MNKNKTRPKVAEWDKTNCELEMHLLHSRRPLAIKFGEKSW